MLLPKFESLITQVYWNGTKLPVKDFKAYCGLFLGNDPKARAFSIPNAHSTQHERSTAASVNGDASRVLRSAGRCG